MEFGAKSQDQTCTLDGKPSVGLAVFQLPGSNAVTTADRVQAKMAELKRRFPLGLDYSIVYDTTPFVRESIHEVQKTLFEAIVLVTLVVLLFLQNWRSVIIPLVAVPVSLIGTFAVMALLGFSLNNISLLGLVLAIGVVVDDAIVVVENVERWIEHGLSPREAAYKSMEEVTVAVIAIAFGLSAVFIPTAFIPGISGQFYRQFALTIAASTLISAFNSLTLSPALAAILLKPHGAKKDWLTALLDATLGWLFRGFNRVFNATTTVYARLVRLCIRGTVVALLVYGGLLWLTYVGFRTVPTGFVPDQDKGYLIVSAQLPDSASLERTQAVLKQMEEIALSEMQAAWAIRGHRGAVVRAQRQRLELRLVVRGAQAVSRPPWGRRIGRCRRGHAPPAVPGEDRRRPGGGLRRPAGRWPGQCRRFQADGQRHQQRRPASACRTRPTAWRRPPISSPGWSACSACSGPTRRSFSSMSIGKSASGWAFR